MIKILVRQAIYSLFDDRTAFLIYDRLSCTLRGLDLADPAPEVNTT
jgi:hypothetical protein